MPSLTVVEFDAQELVRAQLAKRTPFRTPGVHISDVIGSLVAWVPSLAKTLDSADETRDSMFLAGLLWESAVGDYLPPYCTVHQMECEGILLTADWFNPFEETVIECKCTWKSMRKSVLDDFRWMTQVKGYCYGFRVHKAQIWCYHLNGDYAPPSPVVARYDLEFTDREIAENWQMLQNHKRLMAEKGPIPQ